MTVLILILLVVAVIGVRAVIGWLVDESTDRAANAIRSRRGQRPR